MSTYTDDVEGWVSDWRKDKIGYSAKHDAYYNPATGEWLEGTCGDPDCEHCKDRPPLAPDGGEDMAA